MGRTKKISVRDIICDVSLGVTHEELMYKYALTPRALRLIFRKLSDARAVSRTELFQVLETDDTGVVPDEIREQNRYYLDFDLPIYELNRPEIQGRVRDISAEGVGLVGLDANVDETKTLVVLGDVFGEVSPFEFEATCRWSNMEDSALRVSGFQIIEISPRDLQELQRLTALVTVDA